MRNKKCKQGSRNSSSRENVKVAGLCKIKNGFGRIFIVSDQKVRNMAVSINMKNEMQTLPFQKARMNFL